MSDDFPIRLKVDAILEAVLELRFDLDSSVMPEIAFGRFADAESWRGFRQIRLPTADIPAAIRRADPNLRHQPSIELVSANGSISVRIGPQVIAYSRRGEYPGWNRFGKELNDVVVLLHKVIPSANVRRIGLRYINALRSDAHGIRSIADLDLSIKVAGDDLYEGVNVNFKKGFGRYGEVTARIATVDMAEGAIPEHATVIADIDVYTLPSYSEKDQAVVTEWIENAHSEEKRQFFNMLGREATERLRDRS